MKPTDFFLIYAEQYLEGFLYYCIRRHDVPKILRAKRETHKCSSSIRPSNAFLVMVLILLFCKTLENTDTCLCQTTLHILESDETAHFNQQTYSEFSLFKPTNMPIKSSMARDISLLRMSLE